MDRFISMQMFVRAVEKGSLTAAAEGSGMTSTMVGNHIRELEARLGAKLIVRTTRTHTVTEIGRQFYFQCLHILELCNAAESSAQAMMSTPKGHLRISAPISFGVECLAPVLGEFLGANPEVELELSLKDRIVDIAGEEIDAAIRIGQLPDSGLVARPIASWRRVLCASPKYIESQGEPETLSELASHRCLMFNYTSGPERDWKFPRPDGSFDIVRVQGHLSVNNGQALRAAARSGLGIIMQPEELVRSDLDSGRLKQVLSKHCMPSSPMHIVYVPDRQMTPKLSAFIDFVVQKFRKST